jgi:hypothetical protein
LTIQFYYHIKEKQGDLKVQANQRGIVGKGRVKFYSTILQSRKKHAFVVI